MLLLANHTHLYPGSEGRISGFTRLADLPAQCDCLVEFTDGSAAGARLSLQENGWQLDTDAYRTAAGTDIAAKRWRVGVAEDSGSIAFRILKRLHD